MLSVFRFLSEVDFLCGVPICGSALCFVFCANISALISRIRLSSWSESALLGVGNVVLLYFRFGSVFPIWCVYHGVYTMVLVLTCFCCSCLLMWLVA